MEQTVKNIRVGITVVYLKGHKILNLVMQVMCEILKSTGKSGEIQTPEPSILEKKNNAPSEENI